MTLSSNPSDDEILKSIEAWVDDLALGNYASAFARTDHDTYHRWTPELMQSVIEGYGLPAVEKSARRFSVTSIVIASGSAPRRTVDRETKPPNAIAYVEYRLPLNGTWCDLSASFRVEPRTLGSKLVLEDIHVL